MPALVSAFLLPRLVTDRGGVLETQSLFKLGRSAHTRDLARGSWTGPSYHYRAGRSRMVWTLWLPTCCLEHMRRLNANLRNRYRCFSQLIVGSNRSSKLNSKIFDFSVRVLCSAQLNASV